MYYALSKLFPFCTACLYLDNIEIYNSYEHNPS